jgi:hypothetical protein
MSLLPRATLHSDSEQKDHLEQIENFNCSYLYVEPGKMETPSC